MPRIIIPISKILPYSFTRGMYPHINDLVHTRLDVRFDYSKSYLYGKAWITVKPHFYPTDSLTLDAKGMDIKEVSMIKGNQHSPLKYNYDDPRCAFTSIKRIAYRKLHSLHRLYLQAQRIKVTGQCSHNGCQRFIFYQPIGTDKNKPVEVWTQGETESNSVWFPTIDKPDQKCTEKS